MRADHMLNELPPYELGGLKPIYVEQDVSETNWGSEVIPFRRRARSIPPEQHSLMHGEKILPHISLKAKVLMLIQMVILLSLVISIYGFLSAVKLYTLNAGIVSTVPYAFMCVIFSLIFAVAIQMKTKFKKQ